MTILNAKYFKNALGETTSILCEIDGVKTTVPLDPANRHYAEIMRQVEVGELVIQEAEGNEPLPADEPIADAE